jgi:Tfp pilus assembly protein PilE
LEINRLERLGKTIMFCPTCKSEIPDGSPFCPKCGSQIVTQPAANVSPQSTGKTSGRSITALVLGIVGITACGCAAPIAIIIGWLELNKIKKGLSSPASKTFALVGMILGIAATAIMLIMIPILVAIAVPNFFQAQTRAKVSRIKADLRTCATALEAYYIDNNAYPQPDYDNSVLPHSLTTPISYLTSIPSDFFSFEKNQRYHYYTGEIELESENTTKPYWIISSLGPDQKIDIDVTRYNPQYPDWGESYIISKSYDPTNGTTSQGDIWRTSP